MSCQPTPTETQFTTSLVTSYPEHVVTTTEFVTVNKLRARQDPAAPGPTPTDSTSGGGAGSPSSSLSSSSSSDQFGINEVQTTVRSFTITDTQVVTNTIPVATLYAQCPSSQPPIVSNSASSSSPITILSNSSASPSGPGTSILTDLSLTSLAPDNKLTTTASGVTVVISEFITTVNGVETIYATPIQTLLNTDAGAALNNNQRIAAIAGSAVGAVLVVVALLGLLFYTRRKRQVLQRQLAQDNAKRRPARHLLEDEADDFPYGQGPPMMGQYWDSGSLTSGSMTSAPRLLRARGSKTGSLFQEDVWPPPSEVMQDPLLSTDDLGSSISLAMASPPDVSASLPDPAQSNPMHATAISTNDIAGIIPQGRHPAQQRSSAYESIRSMDSTDYYGGRSHSRAESFEPLLDSNGRNVSPPPVSSQRPLSLTINQPGSAANTLDRRTRRSNLRVSYTADEVGQASAALAAQGVTGGTSPPRSGHFRSGTGSGYSASSISPQNDRVSSPEDMHLRGVAWTASPAAAEGTNVPTEMPPMYHTIPRGAS